MTAVQRPMWRRCPQCTEEGKTHVMFKHREAHRLCFLCWLGRYPTPARSPRQRRRPGLGRRERAGS